MSHSRDTRGVLANAIAADGYVSRAFAAAESVHDPTLFELLAVASLVLRHAIERAHELAEDEPIEVPA